MRYKVTSSIIHKSPHISRRKCDISAFSQTVDQPVCHAGTTFLMETKLNYKRTFLIGLAFLSICSFWQMYDNIIPLILQNTYHLGETMTGAVMALDNVLAIFLLPVFGALSDKVHTKLGRRMPFIVAGTILAVIFMMLLPMIDNAEKASPIRNVLL